MKTTQFITSSLACVLAAVAVSGCLSIKTEHEIKPIQITMDINLKVDAQIDKALAENEKPDVKKLVQRGAVGIDNKLMLVPRGALNSDEMEAVMQANAKAKEFQAKIAEENNTTVEEIQKRGLAKVAERVSPGAWYQEADGNWVQKK